MMNVGKFPAKDLMVLPMEQRTETTATQRRSLGQLALAIGLVAGLVIGVAILWRSGLLGLLSDKDKLVPWLRSTGIKGPLLCIGIQFVQVVIFIIPGEITQFAAGYVFGIWKGFFYSIIGIGLGSAFNFYFARIVGRPTLEKLIGAGTLAKVDALLTSARGKSAVFLLFLIPGTPKDALCYGAGLSRLGLLEFTVIMSLGRSPALIASTLLGSQASQRNYIAMAVTGIAMVIAITGYYLYERRRNERLKGAATRQHRTN